MDDTLLIAAAGFCMGFFGSVPPTGPVALMVISRAFKNRPRYAFAAGVGGALAEIIYAGLAVTGVGLLLQEVELAKTLVRALSTVVLLALGLYFFLSPLRERDVEEAGAQHTEGLVDALGHLAKAFSVSIVNPTLILNWTVAVAFFFALFDLEADLVERLLFAGCVGVGMICWTAVEVWLLDKFQKRYSVGLLARIQRGVSVVVMAAGLYLGYRTVAGL